ncbi:Ger(x)C family spore germination protein [Faecalispora anaeroviscerum]|uniref:Ger(x)C family spore germination protein n=1 Tax=Faecalispora anaeroviscerum TaxID=2991836 RepID=UPI0024BA037F|nr:Ger(x)C family spore germination protein [Faecalispora anaeroviscerum]
MKKNIFALLLVLVLSLFALTGCWDRNELNQLGFATALGFDKTSDGKIMITAQVLNPRAIAAQKTTNEAAVVVVTAQGDSILQVLRSMSTELSRKLVGTHMQTIVFGEAFAKEGIAEATDFLLRHYQTSSELYFTVAKGTTANKVLNNLTKLDNDPSAKINSSIVISQQIWAETNEIKLTELVNCIVNSGVNAVITGVEIKSDTPNSSLEDLKKTQNDPIQLSGNAIFKVDKLVGWLNEGESQGCNYISGNIVSSAFVLEGKETGKITLNMKKGSAKQEISMSGGTPKMKVKIEMLSTVQNIDGNFDITKQENLNKIQVLAEEKLKETCMTTVTKAKALKSDFLGFGDTLHRADPQLWKSLKSSWNDTGFVHLPVEIEADVKIIGTDSISQSFLSKEE